MTAGFVNYSSKSIIDPIDCVEYGLSKVLLLLTISEKRAEGGNGHNFIAEQSNHVISLELFDSLDSFLPQIMKSILFSGFCGPAHKQRHGVHRRLHFPQH